MGCPVTIIRIRKTIPEQPISQLIVNEKTAAEWIVPELSSRSGEQFRNNLLRDYFFIDNELRNGLFWNYSPDLDDSSETVHSAVVLRCHHCIVDALLLLNTAPLLITHVADDTHRHSKPLLPKNTATTVHLHYTSLFHCSITLIYIGVKLSLQTGQFRTFFKIWRCLKKAWRCRKKQPIASFKAQSVLDPCPLVSGSSL